MLARVASRSGACMSARSVACWSRREFHLQPTDIPDLLKSAGATLASSLRIQQKPTQSFKDGLAVLISADRDPQKQWPVGGRCVAGSHFYGPSIITASSSALSQYQTSGEARYFGQGGIGLLKLRREEPAEVRQIGMLSSTENLPASEAQKLTHGLGEQGVKVLQEMWKVFERHEGLWFSFTIERSPDTDEVLLIAPYLEFDDFAVRRQSLLQPYFASRPRNTNTARAEDGGLFYVKLSDVSAPTLVQAKADGKGHMPEGNVGCFGYGAGNAMATMDGLNTAGGRPANFLDGGGGANRANAKLAVETLNRDPAVKAIFINTFGGITRTDVVAEGIIEAVKEDKITKPIVVRLKGTGSEEGAKLKASGLDFAFHDDFNEAAAHAVRAANQGHL